MEYAFSNYITKECIYPFYASYKVTHKCGLKCEFCNVWMEKTPDLKKEDVSVDDLINIQLDMEDKKAAKINDDTETNTYNQS